MLNYHPLLAFILISFLFCTKDVDAQNAFSQKVHNHIIRYEEDSLLPEETLQQLKKLNEWLEVNEEAPKVYTSLLDKYLSYLSTQTFKNYTAATHEDIISQALNILMAATDASMDMKSWSYSLLPEYYN